MIMIKRSTDLNAKSCRRNNVTGETREQIFHIANHRCFRFIRLFYNNLRCLLRTFDDQLKHLSHFAAGERRT